MIVRPQPAHLAARFFLGALLVERHQIGQHRIIGQINRPAIGSRHGGIELVVQLLQDQHQPIVEDALFFGRERRHGGDGLPLAPVQIGQCLGRGRIEQIAMGRPGADALQHIVEARQGQVRMRRQHALAVRIQFLRIAPDDGLLRQRGIRKGEGVKAA